MSRKSRQRRARMILRHVLPPWLAVVLLLGGLWLGIWGLIGRWISQPALFEETIPLSATMQRIEPDYKIRKGRGTYLDDIKISFEDHKPLYIDSIIAHESLLTKLESYPRGTVFDMRLEPNGIDIMTLSVDGVEVLTYEAACRAIEANNIIGIPLGIFMLAAAAYSAWSLIMTWRYRRIL